MNKDSYWGPLNGTMGFKTPKDILMTQKQYLHEETEGLVTGDIRVKMPNDQSCNVMFDMVTTHMKEYRIRLLTARYKPVDFYPVELIQLLIKDNVNCKNEKEFREALKLYLNSEVVKKVIMGLVHESRSASIKVGTKSKEKS